MKMAAGAVAVLAWGAAMRLREIIGQEATPLPSTWTEAVGGLGLFSLLFAVGLFFLRREDRHSAKMIEKYEAEAREDHDEVARLRDECDRLRAEVARLRDDLAAERRRRD